MSGDLSSALLPPPPILNSNNTATANGKEEKKISGCLVEDDSLGLAFGVLSVAVRNSLNSVDRIGLEEEIEEGVVKVLPLVSRVADEARVKWMEWRDKMGSSLCEEKLVEKLRGGAAHAERAALLFARFLTRAERAPRDLSCGVCLLMLLTYFGENPTCVFGVLID